MMLLSSITSAISLPDKVLQKGEPSPEFGVWTSPDNYRLYTIKSVQFDMLDQHLNSYLEPQVDLSFNPWRGLLAGVLVGLGIGFIANHF